MPEFHAPYNFVPVTGKIGNRKAAEIPWEDLKLETAGAVRHDYWPGGLNNGRIVCQLTLETPTVVGCQQIGPEDASKFVEPYRVNGELAIPGSSLRGMVSSIVETLSQSAMRVLDNTEMSVRKSMIDAISAIGLLKQNQEGLQMMPITVGPIPGYNGRFNLQGKWREAFAGRTWRNILPVYLSGYEPHGNDQIRKQTGSFLAREGLESFQGKRDQFYWAKLTGPEIPVSEELENDNRDNVHQNLKVKNFRNRSYLLGQFLAPDCERPLTQAEYDDLPKDQQSGYTMGALFILGIESREKNMPRTKKHEYFLPLPKKDTSKRLHISDEVLNTFEHLSHLVDPEGKNGLPYAPQGYPDAKPKSGRLMRFDLDNHGKVREIAWSAIWRRLLDGSVYDFFGKISPDLLPWSPERQNLTPAEAMFGVVGEGKPLNQEEEQIKPSSNLASRVRFTDARAVREPQLLPEETLKILGSPKLPCPTMYFKSKKDNSPIQSKSLAVGSHRPRGRKFYLHHPLEQTNRHYWKSESSDENSAKQKLRVQPLCENQSFWFHIDFDNLSDAELNLLLTSLRPSKEFRHRLGLGKPLGLGTVRVDLAGVFLIDRLKRYRDFRLDSPRYHTVVAGLDEIKQDDLRQQYPVEAAVLEEDGMRRPGPGDRSLIDETTLTLLCACGDPGKLRPNTQVRYPYVRGQENDETEGFKWFVNNDRVKGNKGPPGQELGQITPQSQILPTLKTD